MKKWMSLAMAATMCVGVTACGSSTTSEVVEVEEVVVEETVEEEVVVEETVEEVAVEEVEEMEDGELGDTYTFEGISIVSEEEYMLIDVVPNEPLSDEKMAELESYGIIMNPESQGWLKDMTLDDYVSPTTLINSMKVTLGADYLPDTLLDGLEMQNVAGIQPYMYRAVYGEFTTGSDYTDTVIVVNPKAGYTTDIVEAYLGYKWKMVDAATNDVDLAKANASKIIVTTNDAEPHIGFIMLGGDPEGSENMTYDELYAYFDGVMMNLVDIYMDEVENSIIEQVNDMPYKVLGEIDMRNIDYNGIELAEMPAIIGEPMDPETMPEITSYFRKELYEADGVMIADNPNKYLSGSIEDDISTARIVDNIKQELGEHYMPTMMFDNYELSEATTIQPSMLVDYYAETSEDGMNTIIVLNSQSHRLNDSLEALITYRNSLLELYADDYDKLLKVQSSKIVIAYNSSEIYMAFIMLGDSLDTAEYTEAEVMEYYDAQLSVIISIFEMNVIDSEIVEANRENIASWYPEDELPDWLVAE